MNDSRTPADLDRLFAKLLEDELQPSEEEQLNRALRDDPAVRLLYRKYMTLDAMLRWEIAPPLMRMGDKVRGAGIPSRSFLPSSSDTSSAGQNRRCSPLCLPPAAGCSLTGCRRCLWVVLLLVPGCGRCPTTGELRPAHPASTPPAE